MTVKSFIPADYWPTSPRSGNEGGRLFRMRNVILRGESREPYAEVYGGSLDLGQDIPTALITGTVECVADDSEIVGTGTSFVAELHLGQRLEVFGGAPAVTIPLVVDEVIDDTHFRACRAPYASTTGASVVQLPRCFEVNKSLGSLLTGNAIMKDQGTILVVGTGTLRLNGQVLPGTSLVADREPKIAVLNPSTGNYSVYPLGLTAPAAFALAEGAAGTKNMQQGVYSARAVPARIATRGYGNPSPKAEASLTVAGNVLEGTFDPADTANGQDAWIIFATLHTQQGGINGPWYKIEVPVALIPVGSGVGEIPAAGGTYSFEYNDAEISGGHLLTFNNDPPPDAEFVAELGGIPIWISCEGPGSTSPGPFIAPAKATNIEAAPAGLFVSTSLPDTIIGFYVAQGRLYLACAGSLQITMATQTTDPRIPPVVVRPYWKSGFQNADCLLFVDGYLVGMTTHGLARSIAEGDEGTEEFGFATAVEELLRQVNPGHCLLALDPKNNAIVLFESGHSRNADGFWTTRAWMFSLRENKWVGDILLSSNTGDRIVSGAVAVNGQLLFLCGGRTNGGTTVVKTYRWDDPEAGEEVPAYLAWQFSDWGDEERTKRIGPLFQVVGKFSAGATAGIYGAEPGESIPVTALEAGNHPTSKSGTINLPVATTVVQGDVIELNVTNLKQFTVRIDFTWNGVGERDRIDEVVIEAVLEGARR